MRVPVGLNATPLHRVGVAGQRRAEGLPVAASQIRTVWS